MPIPPADCPPDNVVEAFLPDDATAVVPQPRYPDPSSSRISNGPSLPPDPTAGIVGSLLGLYPYSSTSFLLISSASLRCFRFLQKNIPAAIRAATATIGTTTAIAIVPPLDRPLLLALPVPAFERPAVPEAVEEELDAVDEDLDVMACVDVIYSVVTCPDDIPSVGVTVTTDTTTEDDVGSSVVTGVVFACVVGCVVDGVVCGGVVMAEVVGVVATDTGVDTGVVAGLEVGVVAIEDDEVVGRTTLLLGAVVGSVLGTVVDGLVLAIALDEATMDEEEAIIDSEVAAGATPEEIPGEDVAETTCALVAILVVLEDIMNCLTTNLLGFL